MQDSSPKFKLNLMFYFGGCGNSKTMSNVAMVGMFFGFLGSGSIMVGYFSLSVVCVSRSSQAFVKARFSIRFLSDIFLVFEIAF